MEKHKWDPSDENKEVMESAWIQIKGACEKLKQQTQTKDVDICNMLQEVADRYYS